VSGIVMEDINGCVVALEITKHVTVAPLHNHDGTNKAWYILTEWVSV
jgi:hypothetical protein